MDRPLGTTHDTECLPTDDEHIGEVAPLCPRCGGIVGALPWLPPYRIELELHGSEAGDWAKGVGDELVFSERFANAFRAEGLTGLGGFSPVEIEKVIRRKASSRPSPLPLYIVTTVDPSCTAVDLERSRLRHRNPVTCLECRVAGLDAVHGYALEAGSWDGKDLFRPRGLRMPTVSERFVRFVERHGFTNMTFTPIEKYIWDPLRLGPPNTAP